MPTRYQVPAEVDCKAFVTDQQMDTPDGRIEAKKFVKKVIQESIWRRLQLKGVVFLALCLFSLSNLRKCTCFLLDFNSIQL